MALREMLDAQGCLLSLQILDMARQRNKRVKVVGGGHSPSDIACTDDFMIQMGKMNRVLKVRLASGRWRGGPGMWWHACSCSIAIPRVGGERMGEASSPHRQESSLARP